MPDRPALQSRLSDVVETRTRMFYMADLVLRAEMRCAVLYCAVLRCTMLAVLCCAVLCCSPLKVALHHLLVPCLRLLPAQLSVGALTLLSLPAPHRSVFATHVCMHSPLEPLAQQLVERALPHKWAQLVEAQQAQQAAAGLLGLAFPPSGQPAGGNGELEAPAKGGKQLQQQQQKQDAQERQRQAKEEAKRQQEAAAAAAAAAALLEEEEQQAEKQVGDGSAQRVACHPTVLVCTLACHSKLALLLPAAGVACGQLVGVACAT